MKVDSIRLAHVAAVPGAFPRDGRPEVCVLGRSNVGKSSLINRLVGKAGFARVSKTPGRTREIHFYLLDERWYLVDLPGFGYASVSKAQRHAWGELVGSYFGRPHATLRLALQLVDVRHDPTELDAQVAQMLRAESVPSCLVLTKADKVSNNHLATMRRRAPEVLGLAPETPVILTSATTGAGVKQLSQAVMEAYAGPAPDGLRESR